MGHWFAGRGKTKTDMPIADEGERIFIKPVSVTGHRPSG